MGLTRFIVIVSWVVVFASTAKGFDDWTEADSRLEGAYLFLHVIDWGQTLYISDHRYTPGAGGMLRSERNPFLGTKPSRREVHKYFAITGLLHIGVTHALPQRYRKYWQYLTISTQAAAVHHNYQSQEGLRLAFDFDF